MALSEILFVLRRHRVLLVVAVLVGLGAGWLTAPGTGSEAPEFRAGHVLITNPQSTTGVNLDQAALRATTNAVLSRAAASLGQGADRLGGISASPTRESAALTITARAADPRQAEAKADAVAAALIDELGSDASEGYEAQVADLDGQAQQLRDELARAQGAGASESELAVIQSQLGNVLTDLSDVTREGPPDPPLVTVEAARAQPVEQGLAAPDSKPARAALLGGFGLLAGLACIFALDRLDTRIHTKRGAEEAFGYPVIAEIPRLPRTAHGRELLSSSRPGSHFVEAFRGLRAYVSLADREHGMRPRPAGEAGVVLVTSPLAGEGKTTSVAHLAAMLAEVGRSVLVVSGDFRRPRIHEMFGRNRAPGLTEVLSGAPAAPDVADLDLRTPLPDVHFLASGAPARSPSVIVKRVPDVLQAARPHWDFILIDSAPLLVANDSADLARAADGVVIIVRSGRTTVDAAMRTSELLKRIEAPVLGLVLVGAEETPTAYRYYRRNYYADLEGLGWWERRRRMLAKAPTAPRTGDSPPSGAARASKARVGTPPR